MCLSVILWTILLGALPPLIKELDHWLSQRTLLHEGEVSLQLLHLGVAQDHAVALRPVQPGVVVKPAEGCLGDAHILVKQMIYIRSYQTYP